MLGLPDRAGSLTLVHFFATWCEPCRDEFASLGALQALYGERVSILAISVGEVAVRVRTFVAGLALPFAVAVDPQRAAARAWSVVSLPTTFVLDRQLIPRLVAERDLDWTSAPVLAALAELAGAARMQE